MHGRSQKFYFISLYVPVYLYYHIIVRIFDFNECIAYVFVVAIETSQVSHCFEQVLLLGSGVFTPFRHYCR